jgi:copper(I)-binding protein
MPADGLGRSKEMKTLRGIAITVAALSVALLQLEVAAAEAAGVKVKNGWVSLPLLDDEPAEAYFLLQNSGEARKLVGASSAHAERIEIHRVGTDGSSQKIDEWELPRNGSVLFSPGGILLVLVGAKDLELGKKVSIELAFADGDKLSLEAVVKDE